MATACRVVGLVALLLWWPEPVGAQYAAQLGGPFGGQPVLNAPFSADVTTRTRDHHPDGTIRTKVVTGRYFRDSRGQVRAEVDTPWGPYIVLSKDGQARLEFYRLSPTTRTYMDANLTVARWIFNGEAGLAVPAASSCFESSPTEPGTSDENRLRAVNAEVAPELGIVRASSRVISEPWTDSDGQRVQRWSAYEVSNIKLEEPPATLFEIPGDYQFAAASPAVPLVRWTSWARSSNRCNLWKGSQ